MKFKQIINKLVIISSIAMTVMIINTNTINADTVNNINNKVGVVLQCDYLNIRTGPSVSYSVATKAYTNDKLTILSTNSNGWVNVKTNSGKQGWVNGKYISIKSDSGQQNISDTKQQKINKVISVATAQLGKPYRWGSNGPSSFDCSGFTSYVYKNSIGKTIPRTSKSQAVTGTTVSKSELMPGDLLFFNTFGSGVSHVGMYVGNSKFIHASTSKYGVKYDSIDSSYYSSRLLTAKRIID